MNYLIIAVILSCSMMNLLQAAAYASPAAGRLVNKRALGITIQTSLHTASRFFLVIFLPSLGFLVESNISYEKYFIVAFLSLFLSFLSSFFLIYKLNILQRYFQRVFDNYIATIIPLALLKAITNKYVDIKYVDISSGFTFKNLIIKKVIISFIAYSFLCTGYFLAFLLSLKFSEYRLTLSQFTIAFHTVGAIIVAFYLDPMLSSSIDLIEDDNAWLNNLYSILYGRVMSFLATSLLFLILYFVFLVK